MQNRDSVGRFEACFYNSKLAGFDSDRAQVAIGKCVCNQPHRVTALVPTGLVSTQDGAGWWYQGRRFCGHSVDPNLQKICNVPSTEKESP